MKNCWKVKFNSAVGSIFNKKLLKSEVCGSYEQCMWLIDMHCPRKKSQQLWLKKKEENAEKWKRRHTNVNPNTHYIY